MSIRVLLADDQAMVRVGFRMILDIEPDIEVVDEAEDGQVALDHCLRQMPHVILLDWNMPVMSGIDFLRALRQTSGGDQPIVVLCTTDNDIQQIHEAISAAPTSTS